MGNVGITMVAYACMFIGTKYKWAGNEPQVGFDCSGFINEVLRAYKIIGKEDLTAQNIYDALKLKYGGTSEIKEGSILFFGRSLDKIGHVGMAINDWQYIEAGGGDSTTVNKGFVRIRPINYRRDFLTSVYVKPRSPKLSRIRKIPLINRLYHVYNGQKARCYNENNSHYESYGARGITVEYSFYEFLPWVILRLPNFYIKNFGEKLSIGRINHDLPYRLDNIELQSLSDNVKERNSRHGVPQAKLTTTEVLAIKDLLKNTNMTLKQIGEKFNISFQQVSKIKLGLRHKDI